MPLIEGEYEPSTMGWVRNQVETYERTGGREANTLLDTGLPIIIVTTRGNKSGKVRKSPLMRVNDGDRYAVMASMGGAPKHPVWYLNILGDPHVSLQDGPELRDYVAHTAEGDERDEWWKKATEVWPAYDDYQTKTDRQIPVVVLEPSS